MPIRPATPEDATLVCELILELADYEKMRAEAETTPEAVRQAFSPSPGAPRLDVLIAEGEGGEAVGFALFYPVFSTFRAGWSLYLEDLYVRPERRGEGHGYALLQAVAREALRRGAPRLDWVVLDWNALAIDFYRGLGARTMDDWTLVRLDGEALAKLGGPAGEASAGLEA